MTPTGWECWERRVAELRMRLVWTMNALFYVQAWPRPLDRRAAWCCATARCAIKFSNAAEFSRAALPFHRLSLALH